MLGALKDMKIARAAELLSKDEFSADVDWELNPQSVYRCPRCGEEIAFCMRDLRRHAFSSFTNLKTEDRIAFERAADSDVDSNSYLDFYCPGCQVPTRMYFTAWAGGRFTSGYRIDSVMVGNGP